jgi:outer membrane protein assembly factor BamD
VRTLIQAVSVLWLTLVMACAGGAPDDTEFGEVPSAEDLYAQGLAKLEKGGIHFWFIDTRDRQGAIDTFQDIIDNYPYSDYATLAELRIADAYFDQELWEEALSYYRDFPDLHPDNEKVPYTILRTALAYYHQSRPANRDQTATRQALNQLERLREKYPQSAEAEEADHLWRELRTRLGTSVMNIGNFYMERGEYRSAADRYHSVLNEYPGLGLDAEALFKLGLCYREMNLEDEADRIFQVILDNYQGSEVAAAARGYVPASD